jgi:peptidoglycan/LPS O-acetylase OafA/YrhL
VVGVLLALAAGVGSYYLLERPARMWLNRRWGAPDRVRAEPLEVSLASYDETSAHPSAVAK